MIGAEFLQSQKEQMYHDLLELISWKTVRTESSSRYPYGEPIHIALDKLVKKLGAWGFADVHRCADDYVWVEIGDKSLPLIGVVAHLDTVSYVSSQWVHNPLGDEDDHYLYGRGVVDDKCAIVQTLYAMKYMETSGLDYRIRLIIGCNEETDCKCVKRYIEAGEEMPCVGFVPDAKFPYIRSEKGLINVTFEIDKSLLGKRLGKIHGGICGNVIPNHACMQLAGIDMEYSGVSAHSADYARGDNAIIKMFKDLSREDESLACVWMTFCQDQTLFVPAGLSFISFNPTYIEDIGDRVQITFDSRIPIGLDAVHILDEIMSRLHLSRTMIVRENLGNGYTYSDSHPVVCVLKDVYTRCCREFCPKIESAEPLDIAGTTYAKYFPNCVTFGPGFPLEHSYGHREDERISKDSFFGGALMYTEALVELSRLCQKERVKYSG